MSRRASNASVRPAACSRATSRWTRWVSGTPRSGTPSSALPRAHRPTKSWRCSAGRHGGPIDWIRSCPPAPPARVESVHFRPRGVERRIALLQRRRIGDDGRVFRLALAVLDSAFGIQDRLFHAVPLTLLAIAEAPGPRPLALGRLLGGLARRRRGGAAGRFPLRIVGERRRTAEAVEGEDHRGHALEHETVVGDEDERAVEFGEAVLEDLERRNVEVIGGLVEDEEIGGLAHQARDEDAGLLAARQPADRHLELPGPAQKALGPRRDVDAPAPPRDGIAPRTQRRAALLGGG